MPCARAPVPVHSAHVGQVRRVHYRWHAYFGLDVKVFRSLRRDDGTYVVLERDPGVAILSPAWVLDAATCSAMTLGAPVASATALFDLHAVLGSLGFRRSYVDEESTMEAEHDFSTAHRSGATPTAFSTEPDCPTDGGGSDGRFVGARATPAGGLGDKPGGGRR